MSRQPSVFKIIVVDYVALAAVLFPVVSWGMYGLFLATKNKLAAGITFPAMAIAITCIALLVLAWRIRLFMMIFGDGLEASATISNIWFHRDRGRVDYIFTYQGQKYASGNMIHKVAATKALKVGDEVVVMVDRNNPKRAYVRDLYL